jgi:hypothetical protein
MACVDGALCFIVLFEARKDRLNIGMRHRENRRYPLTPRLRKVRGSLARPYRRIKLIQGSGGDREGEYKGI